MGCSDFLSTPEKCLSSQVSQVWEGGQNLPILYPLVDTYMNSTLQILGNSSAGFCFQSPAESGTWLLLPNGFIKGSLMLSYLAFHFFETLYSAFQHVCNGKVHLYKIRYSCYNT